jgi:hypothetical protein
MEMTMTYQPSCEVFPSGAASLHEKMLRLRHEITDAQEYRRKLKNAFEHRQWPQPLCWRLENYRSTAMAIDVAGLAPRSLRVPRHRGKAI